MKTKKYIHLLLAITSIGGGQLYAYNKAIFMTNKGYKCYIISAYKDDEICIDYLKQFKDYIFEELNYDPNIFNNKKVQKVLTKIVEKIGYADEYIIESGTPMCALWGELLAKKMNSKHIIYLLSETTYLVSTDYHPFFYFKLNRGELAGINKTSIPLLFQDPNMIDSKKNKYLTAILDNRPIDIESKFINDLPNSSITITSIGRLEKNNALIIAQEISKFVNDHLNDSFNVIFVGGSDNLDRINEIKTKFINLDNVNLFMSGTMFPIPKSLFRKTDVFVSSAGSATISYIEEKPTISVDVTDGYAIGVLGYTTQNNTYRLNEPKVEISILLEKIIYENFLDNKKFIQKNNINISDKFMEHIEFIEKSNKSKEYYNISTIKYKGKNKLKIYALKILGIKNFNKAYRCFAKLLKIQK